MIATTYRKGVPQRSKRVRSDLAAKQFAGATKCDAVRVIGGEEPRNYILSHKGWCLYPEASWVALYLTEATK